MKKLRIPIGEGITGTAALDRKPVVVDDVRNYPRYIEAVKGARSELAVPLIAHNYVVGVLDIESSRLSAIDNILVHEVAHLIARFLTSKGKRLVRKAREAAAAAAAENAVKPYRATSDKNTAEQNRLRAAAGEGSRDP